MTRILSRLCVVTLCGWAAACASQPVAPSEAVTPTPTPATPVAAKALPKVVQGQGRLKVVPVEGAQSVAVRLLFYTGSIDDPVGKEGLTALTAQLMAEGGTASKTYPELLRALYPMAASVSVQVDKEQTVFYGEVHKDRAQDFLQIISEVVMAPSFDEAAFSRLKKDAINDIQNRLRGTDDENLGKELLNLMLYQGEHPYGHFVGGTVQGLQRITLEEVKAHAQQVFGRQRLLIGLAGAVSKQLQAKAQDSFRTLAPGRARLAEVFAAPAPATNELWIVEKPSATAVAISMGYPHWSRRGHADWPALALLQSFIGEHRQFHGVLMDELREKRGLNYGDYAYAEAFTQEGWSRLPRTNTARRQQHFEVWIRPVAPEDAVFSLRLALLYLDRVLREGLSKEQVSSIRGFLKGYYNLFAMTPMRKLGYALDDDFYGTEQYLSSLSQQLDGLSADQVNEVLRRHLVAQPLRIAMVAPRALDIIDALTSEVEVGHRYSTKPGEEVLADDKAAAQLAVPIGPSTIRVIAVDEIFD